MKKITTLIISFILLVSCKYLVMKSYGIKNPKVENEQTIKKKALKFGLDTTNIVTINSKDFLSVAKGKGVPDCDIFDSNGNYIEYRQSDTSCPAGLFLFIPYLRTDGQYNKTNKTTLQHEYDKCRDLKGQKLAALPKADFYILMYWEVWEGKLNENHVKVWEDEAKQNKNCSIKVIKVNLDFQQYWNTTDRDAIITELGEKK